MGILKQQGLDKITLDELADYASDPQPGAVARGAAEAEFLKRQTEFYERAAKAAEATAASTGLYTKYMWWSVAILAASSVIGVIVQIGVALWGHH